MQTVSAVRSSRLRWACFPRACGDGMNSHRAKHTARWTEQRRAPHPSTHTPPPVTPLCAPYRAPIGLPAMDTTGLHNVK